MFLEPVYLNETMLMNCASYLFKGISLESETISNSENSQKIAGNLEGGMELGFDFFSNVAKGIGKLNGQGENNQLNTLQTKLVKNVTLGSWHMEVINKLSDDNLVEISYDNLQKPDSNHYVKIKTVLKPVEFYSMLEVLKLLLSQSENFIKSSGKLLFKAEDGKNKSPKILNDKIETYSNLTHSLSELIKELESDYLKSNLLEMMMFDEKDNVIGVLDIDVRDKSPNEIKAQLTDGEFIVFGKSVRYIESDSELNLIQRSLLSAITEKLNNLIVIVNLFQEDNPQFLQNYVQMSNIAKTVIEQFIDLKLKGPAIRVKAMSVCM